MKTTKGILRNFTSRRLHTEISDVYKFLEEITSQKGIMTHHLPSACEAIQPMLKSRLPEDYFTDEWIQDKSILNEEVEIEPLNKDELKQFWDEFQERNSKVWESIKDKTIIVNT